MYDWDIGPHSGPYRIREPDVGAKPGHTTESAQIRRMALWMAFNMCVFSTAMTVWLHGQSVPRVAAVAGVTAFGGLVVWEVYHAISRRNGGMLIFLSVFSVTNSTVRDWADVPLPKALAWVALVMSLQVVFWALVALFARQRVKLKGSLAGSPLWDSVVDPPR
ncbi:MAG: hypothetical protein U0835_01850 [Isosphaeraceae bacterium]